MRKYSRISKGHLVHVRHEAVGHADRVLADLSRWMRADWIKVPKQQCAPPPLFPQTGGEIMKHLLLIELGAAVWRDVVQFAVFLNGHLVRKAINRATGREDEVENIVLAHRLDQHQRADDVVVVVLEGLFHGFANGFVTGKMNDGVKPDFGV
jgi:hypothetical protein